MRKYETTVGFVIEIDTKGLTKSQLQTLIDSADILYDVRKDDLEWDNLCFCFKK